MEPQKPPRRIYLNLSDEEEMPTLDDIAWDEVTWSADVPATRQAIGYEQTPASEIAEAVKKDISEILRDALVGAKSEYRHEPEEGGSYIRWGSVERAIAAAVDDNLLSSNVKAQGMAALADIPCRYLLELSSFEVKCRHNGSKENDGDRSQASKKPDLISFDQAPNCDRDQYHCAD